MKENYTTMNLNIRKANDSDFDSISKLRNESWLATYPNEEHDITYEDILDKLAESSQQTTQETYALNSDDYTTIVAEFGGEVVGFCIVIFGENTNVLKALYVLPEFFGKGIGQVLINKALEMIGDKNVVLNVVEYNKRAIKFYEKNGFKIIGKIETTIGKLPSGKIMPTIAMERKY